MAEPISVEKKLELMQQIRSRHERDRMDMMRREHIIYGTSPKYPAHDDLYGMEGEIYKSQDPEAENNDDISFFSLRMLIAVGLVLLIIISDLSGKTLWGIPTSECFQVISQDYESSITRWVNAASD